MSVLRSIAQLRALLDDVAEIDWYHPSWWGLVAGTAVLERRRAPSDPDAAYVTSNGGPRADTFMARAQAPLGLAAVIVRALVQARAGAAALTELHGQFPQQPLLCQLDARSALVRRRPLTDAAQIVFATPAGMFALRLPEPGVHDAALVAELAAVCVGAPTSLTLLRRVDPAQAAPPGAAITVALCCEESSTARHLHRRGWTAGGGPWLGLGFTNEHELVTTSHTVVDGFGHAQIAQRVFAATDRMREHRPMLAAVAQRVVGSARVVAGAALPMAEPLGIAHATLATSPRFAEVVRALAITLEQSYRRAWPEPQRRRARFTPTLQIPIAPGRRDDLTRFHRRVVPGLVALRMTDGAVESLAQLQARLPALLAREAARAGMLTRMRTALTRAPIPQRVVRGWLDAGATPSRWLPPMTVLAGRGCASVLRFGRDDRPAEPMIAVSAPALDPSTLDPGGSTVLTVIDSARGTAVTVSGTGLAGSAAGAAQFLAAFVDTLVEQTQQAATKRERAQDH